uniref:Uncharacterized protein n=1 Tax=Oryza punctata TaxID=4537 RepID=A0A0E0JP82_ORYPU
MAIVGEEYCAAEERVLTVRKTSHFSPGDGFAAYDHRTGGLAFRADTYGRGHGGGAASAGELALLGPAGGAAALWRPRPSGEAAVVAEIRRKVDEGARVIMGRDVFVLRVSAGFDAAFAMAIVLVLDQIAGDEADGEAGEETNRAMIW